MAAGKAVVSTTIGAEGLPTESGRHLLIADGAEGFAEAVLRVVREPDLRRRLERQARRPRTQASRPTAARGPRPRPASTEPPPTRPHRAAPASLLFPAARPPHVR